MTDGRREVSTRKLNVFHRLAQRLVRLGLQPNHVSVASAGFGILAGASIYASSCSATFACTVTYLVLGLVGIQLRLICNLIDGLMAVEGGLKTPTGELYNDFPDRISDVAILLGAGYAAARVYPWAVDLGWFAAVAAVMTAYTRVLGASMKAPHFFSGPMAKQHRMFLMNLALLGSMVEAAHEAWGLFLTAALLIIALGSCVTCVRRLRQISRAINMTKS